MHYDFETVIRRIYYYSLEFQTAKLKMHNTVTRFGVTGSGLRGTESIKYKSTALHNY